jgi:hypothetical protein
MVTHLGRTAQPILIPRYKWIKLRRCIWRVSSKKILSGELSLTINFQTVFSMVIEKVE